jgi:hypothetical protein
LLRRLHVLVILWLLCSASLIPLGAVADAARPGCAPAGRVVARSGPGFIYWYGKEDPGGARVHQDKLSLGSHFYELHRLGLRLSWSGALFDIGPGSVFTLRCSRMASAGGVPVPSLHLLRGSVTVTSADGTRSRVVTEEGSFSSRAARTRYKVTRTPSSREPLTLREKKLWYHNSPDQPTGKTKTRRLAGAPVSVYPAVGELPGYARSVRSARLTTTTTMGVGRARYKFPAGMRPPTFISPATANATAGHPFRFTLSVHGSPAPTISAASLPEGVSFTDHGDGVAELTGTAPRGPSAAHPVTVTAVNAAGPARQVFSIVTAPPITAAGQLVESGGKRQIGFDDFTRSDRALLGDFAPSGQQYTTQGPFQSRLQDKRFIVDPAARGAGWAIIRNELPSVPTILSGEFSFTGGTGANQEFVLISSATAPTLSEQSVQLYVSPGGWNLFYVYAGRRTTVASGSYATPLAQDGTTKYLASMSIDLATSTVTVTHPGGTDSSTDFHFSLYWSNLFSVQLLQSAQSGGVVCTALAAGG